MAHYICCENNKMCNDNLTLFSLPFSCYVFTNIHTDHPSKIQVMIYIKTVHDLDMFQPLWVILVRLFNIIFVESLPSDDPYGFKQAKVMNGAPQAKDFW